MCFLFLLHLLLFALCLTTSLFYLSIQDVLQKLQRIPVLALLPIPAHNWNLRPGTLGKVHLQLHPFLRHRHGGLHLLRLHTHPLASGAGIFPRDLWGSAWEHHDAHELDWKEEMRGKKRQRITWAINTFSSFHFTLSHSTTVHNISLD